MELEKLNGNIIGICEYRKSKLIDNRLVKDIIDIKPIDSLKMVKLNSNIMNIPFNELSIQEKKKVILASKLQDKVIILDNFMLYFNYEEQQYFKKLFKRICKYNKKIILIEPNYNYLLNLVDTIYLKDKQINIITDFYDERLYKKINQPPIIEFITKMQKRGIKIANYTEFNELLKAIYRSV